MAVCGLSLTTLLPAPGQAQTLSWKRQLGTSTEDYSSGVATDSNGSVYISGYTGGSLAGSSQGLQDAWVAKYNSGGTLLWRQQLGSSTSDYSFSVATDRTSNVYISGYTNGALAGPNNGGEDAWVAKYNSSGSLVWKEQLGIFGPDVRSYSVATDSNSNVYISGITNGALVGVNQGSFDAWVAKYNSNGALLWKEQLGTSSDDRFYSVGTDSNGNVYISGYTNGDLAGVNQGSFDAWVAKYNSSGTLLWRRQLGTSSDDRAESVATDSNGSVYISGYTEGALVGLNQGLQDAWVAKYNSSGTLLWRRQLGTPSYDGSRGVGTDSNGNVYISGYINGALAGANNDGYDAWVAKYNSSGTLLWKEQLGIFGPDVYSQGVATDSNSNVYISGYTNGALAGANQGANDGWVAKYNQ